MIPDNNTIIVLKTARANQALKEGRLRAASFQPDERMRRPGLSVLVLDEADLMLSMPGYEDDLRAIAPLVCTLSHVLPVIHLHASTRSRPDKSVACAPLGTSLLAAKDTCMQEICISWHVHTEQRRSVKHCL